MALANLLYAGTLHVSRSNFAEHCDAYQSTMQPATWLTIDATNKYGWKEGIRSPFTEHCYDRA